MSKQIIPYESRERWLAERVQNVTSTECAALFNASPYVTAFELYHAKKTGMVEQRADSSRMRWGRRLQDPIAHGVAEDHGLELRKMDEYIRETDQRIGASFDFQIVGARGTGHKTPYAERLLTDGLGIMEVKTVDPAIFKEQWVIVEGEAIEAPPHIELQVQHQMLVSGMSWALIVALIGGNRVSVIERGYDAELCAAIVQKVGEFWRLIEQGTPPAPDYTRDAEVIAQLYLQSKAGKLMDARGDAELAAWARSYQVLGDEIKICASERDATRAKILERIGDAARVVLAESTISASTVKSSVIPEHTRAAYRAIRISNRKEPTP